MKFKQNHGHSCIWLYTAQNDFNKSVNKHLSNSVFGNSIQRESNEIGFQIITIEKNEKNA